jgi:hypothetical protein
MPEPQTKTLVGRLDKNHPELKVSNPQWRRDHVRALAAGSIADEQIRIGNKTAKGPSKHRRSSRPRQS